MIIISTIIRRKPDRGKRGKRDANGVDVEEYFGKIKAMIRK
jgi:hypothetical protein